MKRIDRIVWLLWAAAMGWLCLGEQSLGGARAAEVDVTVRRVATIPPGTVIADRPPQGWSNLIIKSHPRIGEESLRQLPAMTARLSTLLSTAMLANVQAGGDPGGPRQFALSHVAVGLGTKINGRDVIISSDTQARLGANFGFIEGQVLSGAEQQLQQMRCAARSRTMAVVDGPAALLSGKKHYPVFVRYALLIDPNSGRVDALLWVIDRAAAARQAVPLSPIHLLPPNKIDECVLHVDPNEFILGIPTSMAFALVQPPQGRLTHEFPKELQAAAAHLQFTAPVALALEQGLRAIVARAPAGP